MLVFWCVSFATIVSGVCTEKGKLTTDGDIILGALFPIHQIGETERECGVFNELVGYQYMESMLYAIDRINERKDILPGIKLGVIIYDTCRSPTITADKTKEFIKVTLQHTTVNSSEFAGVIGAFKSGNSVIVANFLRVFHIPQISYGSLTVKLSNKNVFNYFFRTVPPDSFFAAALVKLLMKMKWMYVSIVYSTGTWAETGAQEVLNALARNKICVAKSEKLPRFPTPKEFYDMIEKLTIDDEQPNIVVLVTIQRDSHGLLKAKKKHSRGSRLSLVGSLEWSNRRDITENVEDIADGTIAFGHREGTIPEFEKYFKSLRFNNYSRNNKDWIGEYWQLTYKCRLKNFSVPTNHTKNCTGDEENTGYNELAPVQVVINSVQAMANALDALQKQLCPNTTKICQKMRPLDRKMLLKFLRNVTYIDAAFHFPASFNAKQEVDGNYTIFNFRRKNGKYEYIQVGSWVSRLNSQGEITGNLWLNDTKIRWANGSNIAPLSTCTPKCALNEISKINEEKCCHKCHTCGINDIVVNNTCRTCDEGYVPNLNESRCIKLPLRYVNMDTPLAGFLVFFACLGILADAIVFAVFLKYSNNKLIKASGREMCYFMFVGISTIFIVPLSSLAKPTQGLCYFRRFIMGVSFTICYAPLLMKMFRIHRIFKNANQLRRLSPSNLIGRRSLLMITTGLVAIQGLFCALVFSSDPPILLETFYPQRNELVLECDFKKSSFVIYFMYNAVLIVWCTFYAFRTRHFPKNFNEAMYIGITMYLTCVVWVVFFATFLNADYSISRVYWLSSCSLVIGWITLLGMFGPKLYQLHTKTEFPVSMLLTWGESSFPKGESSIDITHFSTFQRCAHNDKQVKGSEGSRDRGTREEKSRDIPLQPTAEYGFANLGIK